jgi:hypothetical protein
MKRVDISNIVAVQLDRQLREQVELNTVLGRQAVWALDHDPVVQDADVVMVDTDTDTDTDLGQGQVWRRMWMVINRVCTQVRDMMKGQSNHQSYSQVRDKYSIDRWIEYQVDIQVMGPVRREMSSQVWGKLEGQVRDQVIVDVDRHVDRQVYRRIVRGI